MVGCILFPLPQQSFAKKHMMSGKGAQFVVQQMPQSQMKTIDASQISFLYDFLNMHFLIDLYLQNVIVDSNCLV